MRDLEHRRILEQRLQRRQHRFCGKLRGRFGKHVPAAMPDGNIAGDVGRGRQADPDQFCNGAIDAVGFGIDRDKALVPRLPNPILERLDARDRLIFGPVDGDFLRLPQGLGR